MATTLTDVACVKFRLDLPGFRSLTTLSCFKFDNPMKSLMLPVEKKGMWEWAGRMKRIREKAEGCVSSLGINPKIVTNQFSTGQLGLKFKPFSKYPPCYKDISFWINESFTENNLCEVVREVAGDLVEEVQLIDNFTNKKGVTSHCYRIAYRSMERSLTDEEINKLQWEVRERAVSKLNVVLR
ncbi:Phenylalanine-tRNA ligase, beta subunit, ferrodoxin-fold anticodon-binding [Trema orientale]|uniref:phenylalanine--tRNA ligase n=1 Tax=Trema orientale TaxID=63057 RepID=A0A2P5E2Z8_TREOI|nr:Phenylalanine-tRNA ligase, beta subunit, ferrodoxin-fold anticodon-binding [Trema orientale]